MRKIYIFVTILAIAAGIFYSCNKSEEAVTSAENNNVNPQMSQEDIRVMNKIINFKKKMDFIKANPNIKSGESKSVDSAVWYLEAATNFYYVDSDFDEYGLSIDSIIIEIPKTNGEISLNDIQVAYSNIINTLQTQLSAPNGEQKVLVISDVALKDENNDKVTLKVSNGIGTTSNISYINFGDWYWGMDLGKCDGTNVGTDATDIFTSYANFHIRSSHQQNGYFTDITSIIEVYPQDYPTTGNPFGYGHYKLFCSENSSACLTEAAMNYYYNYIWEIIEDENPQPSVYEIQSAICRWDICVCIPGLYVHILDLKYGIWHIGHPNSGN